ncbi:hypothetical protein [Cohnella candidum]|uniref:Exo-alpha-sialidase n=1 Tax=Cohnella candidum TaxID=2674991 RepID=A0A3G3JXV7_9BACL|nr:hypothetical protein [Cohnella candidum]AYQ72992.1 hypothetical protein EAV92_10705 [Cohnella candidum]
MKKFFLFLMLAGCLIGAMPAATQAADAPAGGSISGDSLQLKVAYNRATTDTIISIAADDKGTIMITTFDYLNVTRDWGKSWVTYRLPSDEMYGVHYVKGKFYLASVHVSQPDSAVHAYMSVDGKSWVPFNLNDDEGRPRTISNVQYVNGQYLLLTRQFGTGTTLFTSSNGTEWNETAALPSDIDFITWNGKVYSAFGGGYTFYGKPKTLSKNQFIVDAGRQNRYAEMIVYRSGDLRGWALQSGAVKATLNYTFAVNDVPSADYRYQPEQQVSNGVITLFDAYGNRLTSKDGTTFKLTSMKKTLNTTYDRSPMFKIGKNYMIFTKYWYSSGVVRSKVLTSTDGIKWKTTNLDKSLPNGMYVMQAGSKLIGHGDDHKVTISNDGFHWTRIR